MNYKTYNMKFDIFVNIPKLLQLKISISCGLVGSKVVDCKRFDFAISCHNYYPKWDSLQNYFQNGVHGITLMQVGFTEETILCYSIGEGVSTGTIFNLFFKE